MSVNKIEIQDSNGNTYHPHTSADVVFGADGKPISTVLPLAHSKSGKTHNLSGTIPQSGIVSAQSKATADYADGDIFTINGTAYTAKPNGEELTLPDKAFISGDVIGVLIDVEGAKINFKLGGGVNDTLPSQIINFTASPQNTQITLNWTNPTSDFAGLVITRKANSMPQKVSDGIKLQCGTATRYIDTGLTNGTIYYYRAFPYNNKKQYQTMLGEAVINTKAGGILLSSLPVGTLVKDLNTKYYGVPIIWKIADKNHSGYPANSVTLITDQIITLKCFDGKEPANSDGSRKSYGNNRYIYANMRRWLNSPAGAGAWYAAQHSADAPPNAAAVSQNPYDTQTGFLNTFGSDFLNALLTTTLTVARNTVTDGGSYETLTDKLFLASNTEVGLANENNIVEGAKLALFTDNASRVATLTAEAVSNGGNGSAGAAWYWWLRTPYASSSYNARSVYSDGTLNYSNAYGGSIGVRPLCNLLSSILVLPNPDTDGAYILQF